MRLFTFKLAAVLAAISLQAPLANSESPNTKTYMFMRFDYPGAVSTTAHGINNRGEIVGYYVNPGGGSFLFRGGKFQSVSYPNAILTNATGLNDQGEVVGSASEPGGNAFAFVFDGKKYVALALPNSLASS